jgi:hypothetical protein
MTTDAAGDAEEAAEGEITATETPLSEEEEELESEEGKDRAKMPKSS